MFIYFHADDAGLSPGLTNQVLQCWEDDLIDGFSIIANRESDYMITERLRKRPEKTVHLSVHLNLSDWKCIKETQSHGILIDEAGNFKLPYWKLNFILLIGGAKKRKLLNEIYNEWDSQIVFVKSIVGERQIKAVDGHNHVHMIPSLFLIVTELAKKHNIKYVRFSKEFFFIDKLSDLFTVSFFSGCLKQLILFLFRIKIKAMETGYSPKTEAVLGVQYSGKMTVQNIKAGINRARKNKVKSLEIILHPGQVSKTEIDRFSFNRSTRKFFLSDMRKEELKTLQQIKKDNLAEVK